MPRVTRSRQAAVPVAPSDGKTIKKTIAKKVTRSQDSAKKVSDQNENTVPNTKALKQISVKTSQVKVLESKLQTAKKENALVQKNNLSTIKSPALRDRTNTTNELNKVETLSKDAKKDASKDSTKSVSKVPVKKSTKTGAKKASNGIKSYLVKRTTNDPVVQKKNVAKKDEKVVEEEPTIGKQVQKENSSPLKSQATKRKNISIEDVERLLNDDNDGNDSEIEKEVDEEEPANEEPVVKKVTRSSGKNNDTPKEDEKSVEKENAVTTNKFFKFKNVAEDKEVIGTKDTAKSGKPKKAITRKRGKSDSPYSPPVEVKSTEPPAKKLRGKAAKNYCELSQTSNSPNNKPTNAEDVNQQDDKSSAEKDKQKGLPIYKTIRLSQEKVDHKEEIYEFLYDSQDSDEKCKKRKKPVKRAAVKRSRKAAASVKPTAQPSKKKTTKKVVHNVQFEEQIKINGKNAEPKPVDKVVTAVVPEQLPSMGPDTFEEAPTIKILSDQQLDESRRISLMATPNVPKTITSELKLFGPKNAITSKPTTQYSNMVNHSLIRKSMSPITKLVDNFDAGSPWRPVDTFSRVHKVVQSTPQINKLPSMREKRLAAHVTNLNKISMSQEETIHLSSNAGNSSGKGENMATEPAAQESTVSPRRFGTEISNISPVKSSANTSASSQNSSLKNSSANKKSPVQKVVSPQKSISELPTDRAVSIGNVSSGDATKDLLSNKSPQKKFSTPSPFRFDKFRTSKRIASLNESQSKSNKSTSLSKAAELEPEAGPSWVEKPQTSLRQSNLHNFLNMDELPESTRISTAHGIFDDLHSTPIQGKKSKSRIDDLNVENAFGFDDDSGEIMETSKPTSSIATEEDVKKSVKGKIFPKARVKSAVPSRISTNTVKQTLLKDTLKKKAEANLNMFYDLKEYESEEFNSISENKENIEPQEPVKAKKAISDTSSIKSFSDTFDILCKNGEEANESNVPDSIPLFADLEPVHFTQPPRRSYTKRKRGQVHFDVSQEDSDFSDDEEEKPKAKKKKESKQSKEQKKRLEDWVKSINETFDEIENFDLVVE